MVITELLFVVSILVLAASIPLIIIATMGFWDSPFGSYLKPIAGVIILYTLSETYMLMVRDVDPIYATITTIAAILAIISSVNLVLILTERRKI